MIARAPLPSPHALAAHANGRGYSTIPNEEEEKIDGVVESQLWDKHNSPLFLFPR